MKIKILAVMALAFVIMGANFSNAADTKASALSAATPADGSYLYVVTDPAGSPASEIITFTNFWTNYLKSKADALYQPLESTLTDIADGTISENLVNTANPWAVNEGGTGGNTHTDGGLLVGAGTGAVEALAVGLTTQVLVGGGAGTNPAWGTDLPTAVTIGSGYIYRAGGTDVPDADVADDITLTNISQITNRAITSLSATNWRLFYSADGGVPVELALGASGTVLKSNGAAAAPTFEADETGGTTNYDTIGDPTGAGSISFDDGETATYDGAWDTEVAITVSLNAADLTGDTTALLITAVDNDDANYIPLLIQDDQDGTPDDLFKVDYAGNTTVTGTLSAGAGGMTVDADGDTVVKSLAVTASASPAWAAADSDADAVGTFTISIDAYTAGQDSQIILKVDDSSGEDQTYLTIDGSAEQITAAKPISATSIIAPTYDVTGAAGITFGSADVTAFTFSGQSEDLVATPSADVWTLSSSTGATIAITPAIALNGGTTLPANDILSSEIATIVDSAYWDAGGMTPDGTQCADAAKVTINSGPVQYTIICTDNDAASMYGHIVMPDSWDGGTVTAELEYLQTAADTGALNADIAMQCRGAGETVSSTWGTEVAIDDAAVTGSNAVDHTTSGAVTPDGTCAAGDTLYWRVQVDATGTTTAVATLHFLGLKIEYTSNVGD